MKRPASDIETAYLNRKYGSMPKDDAVVSAMAESLADSRSGYVRCIWHGKCEYCQKPDGSWVLRGCIG